MQDENVSVPYILKKTEINAVPFDFVSSYKGSRKYRLLTVNLSLWRIKDEEDKKQMQERLQETKSLLCKVKRFITH